MNFSKSRTYVDFSDKEKVLNIFISFIPNPNLIELIFEYWSSWVVLDLLKLQYKLMNPTSAETVYEICKMYSRIFECDISSNTLISEIVKPLEKIAFVNAFSDDITTVIFYTCSFTHTTHIFELQNDYGFANVENRLTVKIHKEKHEFSVATISKIILNIMIVNLRDLKVKSCDNGILTIELS